MAGKKFTPKMTPFGTPALVSEQDPEGRGAEARGRFITAPDDPHSSVPHELMHVGVSDVLGAVPGGTAAEILAKALSNYAYGDSAIYQDPGERIAYGYQEAKTGMSDPAFQNSSSPEAVAAYPSGKGNMLVRNLLDLFGGGAESLGRYMGRK